MIVMSSTGNATEPAFGYRSDACSSSGSLSLLDPAAYLDDWRPKSFSGNTDYTPASIKCEPDVSANCVSNFVHAVSESSASGLYREKPVMISERPVLQFSWRIMQQTVPETEELQRSRGGDDYPASVYVIFSTGAFFWQTRALSYVWAGADTGSVWTSPYSDKVRVLVVNDARTDKLGHWYFHRRDIAVDIRENFNFELDELDAVAIMTDSDNAGEKAVADYGAICLLPAAVSADRENQKK